MGRFEDNVLKPQLPKGMLDRLGLGGQSNDRARGGFRGGRGGRREARGGHPQGRKDVRKAGRVEKRTQQRQSRQFEPTPIQQARQKHQQKARPADSGSEDDDDDDPFDVSDDEDAIKFVPLKPAESKGTAVESKPRSKAAATAVTKTAKRKKDVSDQEISSPPRRSRKEQAQFDADDAEIAALEKKLGIKGKKKSGKEFEDDGLVDLLDEVDEAASGENETKRKRSEYDDFLKAKRRKAADRADDDDDDESEGDDSDNDMEGLDGLDLNSEEDGSKDDDLTDDDLEDFDDDSEVDEGSDDANEDDKFSGLSDSESSTLSQPRVRENPYRPPVAAEPRAAGKYIPPSLRKAPASDAEALSRLKRQLQGLLNRLTEANLLTILKDIEQVFASNPRQYVTETLSDLLSGLIADRTALMDTFIILHAGFITAVYKVIGAHFGAQLLERVIGTFDIEYGKQKARPDGSKEAANLIALIAELYSFQTINSNLLFDYLRFLLEELSDLNTELLLKIIKNCGSQLRQDDPSALKDIAVILQKAVTVQGETSLSVRTKFMIETINNLKNNRQKTGVAASQIVSEHTVRMKKTLGTLNARSLATSEPLGIGLADIRDSKKQGKWWLVGASWRNDGNAAASDPAISRHEDITMKSAPANGTTKSQKATTSDPSEPDLHSLARSLRINTDIRRAIFFTLMSSTDYKDAVAKLSKLQLKSRQESEVSRVLLLCAGGERAYNPYYTIIAKKLCTEQRKTRIGFQFGLWEIFKRLGENGEEGMNGADEEDEDTEGALDLRRLVNLARMYGEIIASGGLSISCLKVLTFTYLQPKTQSFLEVLLVTALQACISKGNDKHRVADDGPSRVERAITNVFGKVSEAPQMAKGLQYFLEQIVLSSDLGLAGDSKKKGSAKHQARMFKKAVKSAVVAVQRAAMVQAVMSDGEDGSEGDY